MHLEIKEGSACILVEKSRQTEPFIPAIKELIIDLLLEKCNPGNASNPFRFNIGQFDKEPMFWADRVTPCTTDKANSAAQWVRSWSSEHGIDTESFTIGPHTMMAIVAAFNDPFVGALYLLTASLPYESAEDLINHVKYASKDRPVHVIFLTARSRVDDRAMELLHQVSRRTDGIFRVAYYDENGPRTGRLIEVPALAKHRAKTLLAEEPDFSLAASPIPPVSPAPSVELAIFQVATTEAAHQKHFQKSPSVESYSDLIIKTPKMTQERSRSIGRDILIHIGPSNVRRQVRHASADESILSPLENQARPSDLVFRQESTQLAHPEPDSVRSPEMDEIKKEFATFYWKKRRGESSSCSPSRTHEPIPKDESARSSARIRDPLLVSAKSVDFEEPSTSRHRIAVSPPTPLSSLSSSSSSDEDDDKGLSEKYSPKKLLSHEISDFKQERRSHSPIVLSGDRLRETPTSDRRFSPSSRPPTGRSGRGPVTLYSKSHYTPTLHKSLSSPHPRQSPMASSRSHLSSAKPAWRPATAKRPFVTSPKSNGGRAGVEDRSRAWMNRWMNDWVKRHEPKPGPTRAHAAIQAEAEKDAPAPVLQRSKSEPRKLQVNTYTQTPHEEKVIGEEIHTIRELLTHNNNLLNALNRSGNAPRNVPPKRVLPQKDHSPVPAMAHLNLDDRLVHQQLTGGATGPPSVRPSHPPAALGTPHVHALQQAGGPHWPHWDQGHKTRREHIQNAFDRKEEIRKQHADACYKAMYQKLADDVSRKNYPDQPLPTRHAFTGGGEKIELIAKLPYDNGFQG